MDWPGYLILVGIGLTALFALVTLFLLRRVPASHFKTLSGVLLWFTIIAAPVYASTLADLPRDVLLFMVTAIPVVEVWMAPLLLDMMTSLIGNPRIKNVGARNTLIYGPVALMTFLAIGAGAADPSYFGMEWGAGILKPTRVPMIMALIAVAAVYVIASLVQSIRVLRHTTGEMRTDVALMTFFLAAELVAMPAVLVVAPQVSLTLVSLIMSTLLSVMVARAVIVKSRLLVPQKEDFAMIGPGTKGTTVMEDEPCVELGHGTLIIYTTPKPAREVFISLVKRGHEGLWVTRRSPRDIREKNGLAKTPMVWLTTATEPDLNTIAPNELGKLATVMTGFIRDAHDFVILFEGLEYLSANNGFKSLLNMVHLLNDRIMSSGGSLMLVGNPEAFQISDFSLLRSEAAQVCAGHTPSPRNEMPKK